MFFLEKRYGNKQLLITPHIEKLMNLIPVKSVREVKKIREIYDSIEIHVRNLNSSKIDTSQYGPVLVTIVMSKLPDDIRLLITITMPTNEEWDVNMLLENLKQEIDSREMCFRRSSGTSSSTSNNFYESKNYRSEEEEFTDSTLYTGGRTCRVPTVDGNILVRNVILLRMSMHRKRFCEIKANASDISSRVT